MKKFLIFILITTLVSCISTNKLSLLPEDELFITRKYIGNLIEYNLISQETKGAPHLIIIKTTLDSVYTKITIYSKDCKFQTNERLYLRRMHVQRGIWGSWEYHVENDKTEKVSYKLSELEYENKLLVQTWF